jgi:hypothetical protein
MPSTAKIAEVYHQLAAKQTKLAAQLTLVLQRHYLPRKIPLIGWRFHWNAIWHHRLAIEIACQMKEGKDWAGYLEQLEEYHKQYSQLYSTMPLCSNKSVSHYIGQCALDALLNKVNEKNIITLDEAFHRLVKDGAFTEGSHYSIYVTACFDRVTDLFSEWYGTHTNPILHRSYAHIFHNLRKVKKWQNRITDSDGVMAVIGDGWYEKCYRNTLSEDGIFYYEDMTVIRKEGWLLVKNHRQNSFSLHQHPHGDEILIAHQNDWLIQGSGMPSYKHVMAKPWRWRRPRNHFFSETVWDWFVLWRHRVGWAIDKVNSRGVEIEGKELNVRESGHKVIRWPGERENVINGATLKWSYGKFTFEVSGINIKLLRAGSAYRSTTYGDYQKVPVVRIRGENIETRIKVND